MGVASTIYDKEYSSISYPTTKENVLDKNRTYDVYLSVGFNTEVFIKNRFSLGFLSQINLGQKIINDRYQQIEFNSETNEVLNIIDNLNKSEEWYAHLAGFKWMFRYYFPNK